MLQESHSVVNTTDEPELTAWTRSGGGRWRLACQGRGLAHVQTCACLGVLRDLFSGKADLSRPLAIAVTLGHQPPDDPGGSESVVAMTNLKPAARAPR